MLTDDQKLNVTYPDFYGQKPHTITVAELKEKLREETPAWMDWFLNDQLEVFGYAEKFRVRYTLVKN